MDQGAYQELFTKNSSILKHARFELVPVDETRKWLGAHQLLAYDSRLGEDAALVKQALDRGYGHILQLFADKERITDWSERGIAGQLTGYLTGKLGLTEKVLFSLSFLDWVREQGLLLYQEQLALTRLQVQKDAHYLFAHCFVLRRQQLLSEKSGSVAERAAENHRRLCENRDQIRRAVRDCRKEGEGTGQMPAHLEAELMRLAQALSDPLYEQRLLLQKELDRYHALLFGSGEEGGLVQLLRKVQRPTGQRSSLRLLHLVRQPLSAAGKKGKVQEQTAAAAAACEKGGKGQAQEVPLCFARPKFLARPWKPKHEGVIGNCDHALLQRDGKYYYLILRPAELFGKGRHKLRLTREKQGESYLVVDADKETDACRAVPYLTLCAKPVREAFGKGDRKAEAVVLSAGFLAPVTVKRSLYEGYRMGRYKEDMAFLRELIGFFEQALLSLIKWEGYELKQAMKPPEQYRNLREFYRDIDKVTYRISYLYLEEALVREAVREGEAYLFRLEAGDLYKAECRDVLSLYLRYFMGQENAKASDLMLNGSPRLLYRPPLLEKHLTHPKGSILVNKRYRLSPETEKESSKREAQKGISGREAAERCKEGLCGQTIPPVSYQHYYDYYNHGGALSAAERSLLPYVQTSVSRKDLVKDERYTRELFTITLSFTINREVTEAQRSAALNEQVQALLREGQLLVLEIKQRRGHLLCCRLCGADGRLIEEKALDTLNGIFYLEKLKALCQEEHKERRQGADSYKRIGYREGLCRAYLGDAAAYVAGQAVRQQAVIVLKRGERERENGLWSELRKDFEKALLQKLSCYVEKERAVHEAGGLLNPLQLVTVGNQNKRQNGIVFWEN